MILEKAAYHMNEMFKANHKYFTKNGAMLGLINIINNMGIVGSFIYYL